MPSRYEPTAPRAPAQRAARPLELPLEPRCTFYTRQLSYAEQMRPARGRGWIVVVHWGLVQLGRHGQARCALRLRPRAATTVRPERGVVAASITDVALWPSLLWSAVGRAPGLRAHRHGRARARPVSARHHRHGLPPPPPPCHGTCLHASSPEPVLCCTSCDSCVPRAASAVEEAGQRV